MSAGKFIKDKRGRVWSHSSVLGLMKEAQNGEWPEDVMRRKARSLVAEALQLGWSGPPYDPVILASLRNIRVEAAKADLRADARILPRADGSLVIEFDALKPKTRTNFSICHELSHTFFPDCYETVRHRRPYCQSRDNSFEVEMLCDVGAAELLMPHARFHDDLVRSGTSLNAVRSLRQSYQASSEAVLLRVAQLSESKCAVAFLSEKLKPKQKEDAQTPELGLGLPPVSPKLRVDYVRPSETFSIYIPQDKSVPDDSVAYRCLNSEDIAEGREQWKIKDFGMWRVQAVRLPTFDLNSPRRVAALVLAD